MRLVSKAAVSVFAMMLMASFSLAGTIEGMVTGKDGKAAASVPVRLMKATGGGAKKEKSALADKADKGGEKKAPEVLQSSTTDSEGKFKFENVEDGAYTIAAGNRDAGTGRANVQVKSGKADTVKIDLKEAKAKETK